MRINGVSIDDGFAEAFPMKATRLVITAHDRVWAMHAAVSATGMATSVIACGCEAGIERELAPAETPDGRAGVAILLFAVSGKELAKQVAENSEVAEIVRALEQQYDAFVSSTGRSLLAQSAPLPTADELGAQFEAFLADREGPGN